MNNKMELDIWRPIFVIPAFRRQRQKDSHTFRSSLVYMVHFRAARATQQGFVSKTRLN